MIKKLIPIVLLVGSLFLATKIVVPPTTTLSSLRTQVDTTNRVDSIEMRGATEFLRDMALFESNNVKDTVNKLGYMGRYQFGMATIRSLGYTASKEQFLINGQLQDSIMVDYMRSNNRILRKIIIQYSGTMYRGVYVTQSGILAGAHLGGPGGVMAFFNPRLHYNTRDANGMEVSEYIRKFGGYNLSRILEHD